MLKVTLGTGEVLEIPFNRDSSLTITSIKTVDGLQVESAEAHADVVGVELVDDPIVETPEPVTMTGAEAAAAQPDVQVPIAPEPVNPDSGVEPGTEPPVQEPAAAETAAGDESLLGKVEDALHIGSHDEEVAKAQDAVVAAGTGEATIDHVTAALADVNAALAAYPDSTELADAKFQLESLAGTPSAAQGA